jgi:predicted nuclease of predicted toxin-antitoxin system
MRLLIDEDCEGKQLVTALRESEHDVLTVSEAGLASHADAEVMAFARSNKRVVLTRNARDFLALHEADQHHSGILLEYQGRDLSKNMSARSVVQAINNIDSALPDLSHQFIAINAWMY